MGAFKMFSGGSKSTPCYTPAPTIINNIVVQNNNNPDPSNFRIEALVEQNGHCLLSVKYPNCTNFKGTKVLLVKATKKRILGLKVLDPHFLEEGSNIEVLARFRPTKQGWELGLSVLKSL